MAIFILSSSSLIEGWWYVAIRQFNSCARAQELGRRVQSGKPD
jgi:hypothetical protein